MSTYLLLTNNFELKKYMIFSIKRKIDYGRVSEEYQYRLVSNTRYPS